ncbi:phospholipase D-like domain-containing protein [Planctomicrobium piriforme]|uniref:Cardiolipin synthase n=1 Tax=Planctomicrobium piriforme TaxID=1576369 RepID=A0A1I3FZH2_9PLAN|nr:phospholipase D-like domain-containing protein [Planctomicrobium piriforme]SFI16638.1 cardiolipin synthase [Planctomicrobium piriforme]
MEDARQYWTLFLALAERSVAICAVLHAVLNKRETQSVIGWVGLIWLSPFIGSALYLCFGINRIRRQGRRIQKGMDRHFRDQLHRGRFVDTEAERRHLPFDGRLDAVVHHVTGKPLLGGNSVTPLNGGEVAYPAMLQEIAQAKRSITLCSYIFDNDRAGQEFVTALSAAQKRGVAVRVLIDSVGARYSKPSILHALEHEKIPAATFLPTLTPRLATYANLRLHRKLLVVDGAVGFAGGMNIREGCRGDWQTAHPVQDIHFRIAGPAVSHLQEMFVVDWAFASDEKLQGELWFSPPEHHGDVRARGIPDGPDNDFDYIRLVLLGAIAVAEKRIDIVTPYFLPDDAIIYALNVASMKGVKVRILVPLENNIRLVAWASADPLSHVLERGCDVYQGAPPFDHSKIMLIDDDWALIGSSNWDPRSLRLNFEFNVECYDPTLVAQLSEIVDQKIATSQRLTLSDLRARPLLIRLRDGLARMGIPYL